MTNPLALSPSCSVEFSSFGAEEQPMVTVEQALADPAAAVGIAARHGFTAIGPFYPGVRAPVSERIAMPLVAPLLPDLQRHFGLAQPPAYFECYLSLVTAAPRSLDPIQRLPHFDGVEPERIAVLLYLDRAERGGTGFYRQRSTGFESVDAGRFENYRATLARETESLGLPDPGYIDGDTAMFDRVLAVEGRFNRMIAYRGNTLHCAALGSRFEPDTDPARGRLTLNLFLSAPRG